MREKQTMLHIMSRKGYARLEDEMNDALAKALGPERRGRVRGLGFGATPSQSPCVSTNHQGSGNLPNDSANHHANSANHHATSSKPQAKSSNLDASSSNLNHISPKHQGTKCKLLNWTGTREVVALAEITSTNP
ncbi:hypothetical protein ACFX16_013019 [Malus domestica]